MSMFALPEGWKREEFKRTSGLSSGKIDVFYISPNGKKIKSKIELAKFLGQSVDLTLFDYRTGKINSSLMRKNTKRSNFRSGVYDYRSLRNDPSLTLPVRQTASIFKKPITLIKTQPNSTVLNHNQIKEFIKKSNNKILADHKYNESIEKPNQVFYQKRFEGLHASNIESSEIVNFELPPNMKAFSTLLADKDTLLRSVSSALHSNSHTIRGQERNILDKNKKKASHEEDIVVRNPAAFVNPSQPLIQSTTLSEDDIRRQEEVVSEARRKLRSAIQDILH